MPLFGRILMSLLFLFFFWKGVSFYLEDKEYVFSVNQSGYHNSRTGTTNMNYSETYKVSAPVYFLLAAWVITAWGLYGWNEKKK